MASVFLYHVVGDLTVGKPEMVEFYETETVESAIRAIGESTECGIPVWKRKSHLSMIETSEMRQQRFVGILNSLDIVAFLASTECLEDQDKAIKTSVSQVVVPNASLLKQVDPATRLIDALEMMKQGVRRLLVPKSMVWKGMSKRFSFLYNGKWLKNADASNNSSNNNLTINTNRPSSSSGTSNHNKFCCLSREDVIRFLIGCLGALAPLPLSSISSLGIINPNYTSVEASLPAFEATRKLPGDPSEVAVVEPIPDGQCKIIGEISASRLWKCDYLAAAWALANLSAGQFVMGVEDNEAARSLLDFAVNSAVGDESTANGIGSTRLRKFSSRSIGFNPGSSIRMGRSMYRGRSAPLTCKITSSLAAVMAQMLSHRATHVWVIEDDSDDILVGVVGYADILAAVTKQPASVTLTPVNRPEGAFTTEFQN
ncbi:CBS domain-containing protein CBSX6 [Populus alba]|uniref:CBS domain-containing protein CBSX6-like n=2 Tax=Populus TaxID=3689 RepID=A0A4U5N9K1_POPAL|nr:CBS domain-containing protein CBSX6-like [Populus alba]KAJ6975276.1 CBS domain-containing protein CBSX6-like [Populus alba x Populus x berolinensis]KAJ6975278.1 CBS domain-containing protein CBSX6-like [Populus alba x Populus x berolinensis]KAJ6975293.1 CBS domain-containing protein CBSX6-like [Populus alba x Populus x berolinensis]TKR78471.1 CBS domain-containing protein CBSX6-like [Populus alba]